jgi:hypothetical protein
MFKYVAICAAFLAIGTGPLSAQQQEAVLQKIELPGAGFDILLAMPKTPAGAMINLGDSPEALVVHLIGGELALAFDGEEKMIKVLDSLQRPICSFHAESKDLKSPTPAAVYVVPKSEWFTSREK